MRGRYLIIFVVAAQVLCTGFFAWSILTSFLGLPPVSWQAYEMIELGAVLGLILGVVTGGLLLRHTDRRRRHLEGQLRAASGAFHELMQERFEQWGLTPAERDVALFSIKGLSTAEIALIRDTSDGTVKAQTNAIYRKAGVSGRPQLLSLFIEDLMEGPVTPALPNAVSEPPAERSPAPAHGSPQG